MSDQAEAGRGGFWADATADPPQRYRTLVQAIDDGVVHLDGEGRMLAVNESFLELTGYARDDLLGEHVSLVVDDEGWRRLDRIITGRHDSDGRHESDSPHDPDDQHESDGQHEPDHQHDPDAKHDPDEVHDLDGQHDPGDQHPETVEVTVRTVGGRSVTREFHLQLQGDDDSREALCLVRETTEVASAEESRDRGGLERELRDREAGLPELMANVPGMVYRCRNERGWPMEFVSDACEALTGYAPETVEADEVSWGEDVIVEEDRGMVWDTVQRETAEDGTFSATYRIETADGERRWVRDYGRGVFNDRGELVEVQGIISDITEQKETEQQLAEERDMFADGPAVVFRWEPDQEAGWPVEYVSENVEEVLGYTPAELESGAIPYADLLLDEEIDRISREVEEATDGETERFSHEPYRIETKDGDVRWVKDTTKIVRAEDGTIRNYLGYLVDITERKERERELQRYETIVETVNDGVYVVDDEGRFTMVNEAYTEMVGYDREELLGEHVSLVVDEEVADLAQRTETELRRGTAETSTLEAALRTADGEKLPSEATFALLPNTDGREERVGVARDVSDRKERERELQQKERRYEAIFQDPNILVGLLEPDGSVVDVNQTALAYIDADLDEIVGDPFWETPWWHDEQDDGIHQQVREWTEQAAAGEYVDFEADLTHPDGRRYTISGGFRPVTTDDGDVVSIIVSGQDITERKRHERQLEESERRYRTLVEQFPNGAVGLYNEKLEYTAFGGQLFEDVGVTTEDERIGQSVYEIYPDEIVETVEPYFEAALDGESNSFEVEFHGRDLFAYTLPVRDANEDVIAGMVVVQDVTERREYERKLKESNERLEQFAYAASHDLQEPLRMVSSYLQLIEQRYGDELDEEAQEFVGFAVDGAERMREMIDGLLEYSRVETEGEPFEPVDLDGVLDDVREDLQFKIEEQAATITADSLPRVEGDEDQLRQVFQNLLDNAMEYSGDEPPRIRVSAERDGDQWLLSISDDGIGIEAEHQDRVFEVFQRLHTHDDHAGTGIGLSLCRRIVERHGGEIWVDSDPGAGSTFSFTLPAVEGAAG